MIFRPAEIRVQSSSLAWIAAEGQTDGPRIARTARMTGGSVESPGQIGFVCRSQFARDPAKSLAIHTPLPEPLGLFGRFVDRHPAPDAIRRHPPRLGGLGRLSSRRANCQRSRRAARPARIYGIPARIRLPERGKCGPVGAPCPEIRPRPIAPKEGRPMILDVQTGQINRSVPSGMCHLLDSCRTQG
jgi:hypothetical protein